MDFAYLDDLVSDSRKLWFEDLMFTNLLTSSGFGIGIISFDYMTQNMYPNILFKYMVDDLLVCFK